MVIGVKSLSSHYCMCYYNLLHDRECHALFPHPTPGTSPVQFEGLQPGPHEVKVRPNGENCDRIIRRTAKFTVV